MKKYNKPVVHIESLALASVITGCSAVQDEFASANQSDGNTCRFYTDAFSFVYAGNHCLATDEDEANGIFGWMLECYTGHDDTAANAFAS